MSLDRRTVEVQGSVDLGPHSDVELGQGHGVEEGVLQDHCCVHDALQGPHGDGLRDGSLDVFHLRGVALDRHDVHPVAACTLAERGNLALRLARPAQEDEVPGAALDERVGHAVAQPSVASDEQVAGLAVDTAWLTSALDGDLVVGGPVREDYLADVLPLAEVAEGALHLGDVEGLVQSDGRDAALLQEAHRIGQKSVVYMLATMTSIQR